MGLSSWVAVHLLCPWLPPMYRLPLFFAALVGLAAAASAQTPYDLIPVPSGPVNGIAVVGDTLFFGGSFDFVGPRVGPATALDPATGEVVPGVVPPIDLYYSDGHAVRAVVPDGDGGVYLAGGFRQVDGAARRDLVHVLADGSVDAAFAPEPVLWNGGVAEITGLTRSETVLFLHGRFTSVGGAPRDGFAALDAATGAVLPFNPAVSDASGYSGISAALLRNGVALIAGFFDTVEGQPRFRAAALDFTTGALLPWEAGLDSTGTITHLVPASETLYVLGRFSAFGGAPRHGLAEIAYPAATDAGPVLTPWAPAFSFPAGAFVYAIVDDVTLTDNALWVSGNFSDTLGTYPRTFAPLVRVRRALDATFAEPVLGRTSNLETYYTDGEAVASDGATVWVSVGRHVFRESDDGFVIGIDAETLQPTGFEVETGPLRVVNGSSSGLSPHVEAMAYVGGRLVVAGRTLQLGGQFAPFYGAADLTTGAMLPPPVEPFPQAITDMAPSPDGRRLYLREAVAEQFGPARYVEIDLVTGAQTRFEVPYDGGVAVRDSSAAPPVGPVRYTARRNTAMLATPDRLYLPSGLGQSAQTRLRAVDPFTLRPLPTFTVRTHPAISNAVLADGWLYVSGGFESVNSELRLFYARLDPQTGAVDEAWEPIQSYYGANAGGPMAFADSLFVTGGINLYRINLVNPVAGFAAFSRPSGEWRPWGEGIPWADVDALQYADGVFYAAGWLGREGGVNQFLTAFDRDGARLTWPAAQPTRGVRDLLVSERHGRVFVAGEGDVGGGRSYLGSFPALAGFSPPVASAPAAAPTAMSLTVAPNPVHGAARLTLALPAASASVRVDLVDALGRQVAVLHDGPLGAGVHPLTLNAGRLPAGVYAARVTGAGVTETLRLTVVR